MIQLSDYNQWKTQFKNSHTYQKLIDDFDFVYFHKEWYAPEKYYTGTGIKISANTPRQDFANPPIAQSVCSAIPFYYIDWLQESKPRYVYDLGCGWNMFKKYYPNIIGIDPEPKQSKHYYADIHDFVDADYIAGHREHFDSVFSICALHFIPLSEIRKRVLDFASMIKPGGQGWLSLNATRMLERDREVFGDKDKKFIEAYIKDQLDNLANVQSVDIDLSVLNDFLDGNIQIVFDKNL